MDDGGAQPWISSPLCAVAHSDGVILGCRTWTTAIHRGRVYGWMHLLLEMVASAVATDLVPIQLVPMEAATSNQ